MTTETATSQQLYFIRMQASSEGDVRIVKELTAYTVEKVTDKSYVIRRVVPDPLMNIGKRPRSLDRRLVGENFPVIRHRITVDPDTLRLTISAETWTFGNIDEHVQELEHHIASVLRRMTAEAETVIDEVEYRQDAQTRSDRVFKLTS
jgi:hypothetical protein